MSDAAIIRTEGIRKSFGDVEALKSIDLEVAEGSVFGLLGPNGAGKTTGVRILTTLLQPDAGSASVAGLDVVKDAEALRSQIGLAGQFAAVDENLTGMENVVMVGLLYHLPAVEVRRRAGEVLERFGLSHAANRPVRTYSGGMRRRLDLAASLVARPRVLFLDEPTTGLDPRSRLGLWDMIRELRSEGTTLLLTTQYLEEADILADKIAVIDLGTVIAEGTSDELKNKLGGELLELHVSDKAETARAAGILAGIGTGDHVVDPQTGLVRVHAGTDGTGVVFEAVRRLDEGKVWIADLALHKPTLDDVFLQLTGRPAEETEDEDEAAVEPTKKRRGRSRKKEAVS
ncbi:MAG TPA: ATP-binding cassette domain-containing protein [Actinomycetota bacterium]